jgi:hypothetical protein
MPDRMRKFYIIVLLLFISNFVSAQNNHIAWGLKLGGNIGAPIPFGNVPEGATGAPIVGLNLGSWISYYFNQKISLKLEFNYSIKGASFKTPLEKQYYEDEVYVPLPNGDSLINYVKTTFTGTAEGKFDNHYLEWPIYIQYKIGNKILITGGGYFAYMFATATYANGEGYIGSLSGVIVTRTIPFEKELSKFDYGARLGVAYTNGGKFSFDGNLAFGISSIFKKSYKTIDYPINNFYFQFGVMYNLGKELKFDSPKKSENN